MCLLLGSERELLTIEWPRTGSRRQTLSGGCRGAGAGAVATCSGPWARPGTVLSNPSLHLHTSGCHGPGRPSPRAWSPQRRLYLVWPAPWEGEARSADSEPAFSQPLHTGPPLHVSVYPDRPRAPLPRTRDAGSGGDGTDGRTDGASGGCRGHTHRRPAGPRVVSPELLLPVGRACRLSGRSHPASGFDKAVLRPMIVTVGLWSPDGHRCSDLTSCLFPWGPAVLTSLPAAPPHRPPSVVVVKSLPEDVFIDIGAGGGRERNRWDGCLPLVRGSGL